MNPLVSVIIPVYNAEKYLSERLDSLLNQTLNDIEIICVDDGSTDNSLQILESYAKKDSRIIYVTQENKFAGVARNHGIEISKGEYLAFFDADDICSLELLEKVYKKGIMYDADIVLFGGKTFDDKTRNYNNAAYFLRSDIISNYEVFNRSVFPNDICSVTNAAPWTKMYKREFILNNGLKFQAVQNSNDLYFVVMSLCLASRITYVDEPLYYYRTNTGGSLQDGKFNNPFCFLQALEAIYRDLVQRGIYNEVSKSIQKAVLVHTFYNLRTAKNEDIRLKIYDEIINIFNRNIEYYPPMVSVIIPVYNTEKYLPKCLDSILNQTYKNFEVLCIDDASSDKSLEILKQYKRKDNRVKVFTHDINKHQGGARNTGLNNAKGHYVWFVDSDDYVDEDSLNFLINKMEELRNVDVLCFDADAFVEERGVEESYAEGCIKRKWDKNIVISIPKDEKMVSDAIDGSTVTMFFKRSFINKFRFRENVFFEDADFSFKVFTSSANFYFLDYTPYHRRITTSSTTGSGAIGDNINCIQGRVLASCEIAKYIKENGIEYKYANKWFARWAKWALEMYLERVDAHTSEINDKIKEMNRNYVLFDSNQLMKNRDIMLPDVIVSLTSYPDRISTVHQVIDTVLKQTFKPNKIELYLSKNQFKEINIPYVLTELERNNDEFKIEWVEDDIKPHKKYFYSMPKYSNSIIITFDDDVLYNNNIVERLVKSYCRFPNAVSCMRGHTIQMYDEYTFTPYAKWQQAKKILNRPSYLVLPTGVGGVLYPPNSIPEMAFNISEIKEKCLFVDDLWLKWMELKNCIPCVLLEEDIKLNYIDGSQKVALWNTNKYKNDYGFQKIILDDNGKNIKGEDIRTLLFLELSNKKIFQKKENKKMNARVLNSSVVVASNRINLDKFIPKKIKGGIKCFQEHGLKYTILRCIDHLEFIIKN